jgi:hypothetical protein
MITDQQICDMSAAERFAWIDSLNEDETEILHFPVMRKCILVFVSLVKHLLEEDIPTEYRLKYLQWLERRDDWWCSPRIIAAIEPMCNNGYELLRETMRLGHKKGFDTLAHWEVFNAFVALNPSLLTAIKMGKSEYRFFDRLAS